MIKVWLKERSKDGWIIGNNNCQIIAWTETEAMADTLLDYLGGRLKPCDVSGENWNGAAIGPEEEVNVLLGRLDELLARETDGGVLRRLLGLLMKYEGD